ncbi:SusD-like starch-binding protein associating with outer membrane [Flavobacterium sp. 103]|uniref:RagB/SusD family nutrient uptake outer membrane protein n=1 Tax=Flavobacterium sp. 103 TaxID=2135624 RepID=UPI000D5EAFEE|nr:RagB/SusD family nutrient uptake outer membrane protein [Flavobacterium sp. 103]PVX44651.1 SusD-like starch-binding protein associating with outer membrane [Flavobacterium sp. 103]
MKSNKLILCIILAVFFYSCEDKLDIEPQQSMSESATLNSEAGVTGILVGGYATAASGSLFGGINLVCAELLGTNNEMGFYGSFDDLQQMYDKKIYADNGYVTGIYSANYKIINASNTVIENIAVIKDPAKQKTMVGEANFLKSLAYFDLVRFFAKPYEFGKTNSQLGVVIRPNAIYDFSADLSKERSSVEEVYQLIIDGLNVAYTNLPANNGIYANKYSAKALLARVYLQQGNYAAARDAANDVITNGGFALASNYANAFNRNENGTEDVFAIQITTQTGDNQLNNFYADKANGGRADIEVNKAYVNKFTSSTDERKYFFYTGAEYGGRMTSKFKNEFGDVPLIRLAEMFLIRAEANVALGTTVGDTPLNDINKIRKRALAAPFVTVDLTTVLKERQLELGFEGFLIHDIKRTKQSLIGIPYDADELVFPIPLSEMDTNNKITQNPGYGS